MLKLRSLFLGGAEFGDDEEYLQFRFQMLFFSLLTGVGLDASLIALNWLGVTTLGPELLAAIGVMLLTTIALPVLLWGRKDRLTWVAWTLFAVWFLVDVVMLWYSPVEFRLIYFFLQVAAVYTILGVFSGFMTGLLTLTVVVTVNRFLPDPFSTRTLATVITSMCVVCVFLHAYVKRLSGFHERLARANRRLRELSQHDPLTGVMNARAFYEISDHLIRQALRSGSAYSALFIDLDHFKSVNDRYGHEVGDRVLKQVADCLERTKRGTDVFGRVGGEEFMMLLPHTDLRGAKSLAEKLRQQVELLIPSVGPSRIPVTISIGIAGSLVDEDLTTDIKRRADRAMYHAKATGRNRVVSFEDLVSTPN